MSDAPPPLTRAGYAEPRDQVDPHDHAVLVYRSVDDLGKAFGHYLAQGIERNDLTVFVHAFASDEEAWRFALERRPDGGRLRTDQLVLVSLYRSAFEGEKDQIDYPHVTLVVRSLIEQAARKELRGVRIFVDASRIYLDGGRAQEWFAFESWLGRRLQGDVGLVCAYRESDAMRDDVFPEVLRTHAYRFEAPHR